MTDESELLALCYWNKRLSRENVRLHAQLSQAQARVSKLETETDRLRVEGEAQEALLGAAIDAAAARRTA
ncbi:MAG TPA: hypothetical protein VHT27_02960 [Solirubrobacteraceae bacterium]|jgi:hypothetical protein|nr:hypothetical protein [Solirubrobacteraceae bacterium]